MTAQDISNPAHDNIRDRSPLASPVHKIHSPTSSQICPQNFPANNFSSYANSIKNHVAVNSHKELSIHDLLSQALENDDISESSSSFELIAETPQVTVEDNSISKEYLPGWQPEHPFKIESLAEKFSTPIMPLPTVISKVLWRNYALIVYLNYPLLIHF